MKKLLPELLSPAGSLQAFEAAIDGGADAIYVGGASFNARINAKNFSADELAHAVKLAHTYGVKVYQTVNIMIHGKEIDELVQAAKRSAEIGVDAFIVSDIGAARILHEILPDMPLHGSTQMSVHSSYGAEELSKLGFTRVVPARELSQSDILTMVKGSPIEVEMFIHGAMCVSHSGQCLFSSLVGGRSGNRGLCAQPCRLPYGCADERVGDKYPLSLKDMSLATHVRDIIDSGVASLKIEGRMKSPEYVQGVTRIWRRLLDEGKNADASDIKELAELFSRGGFTDGYYTESIGRNMLGIRSDDDKQATREAEKFNKITRKIPIDMTVRINEGLPSSVSLSSGNACAEAMGEIPQKAINAPIDEATVRKSMGKLGDSPFVLNKCEIILGDRLMMPVSQLNALRRAAVEALEVRMTEKTVSNIRKYFPGIPLGSVKTRNTGRFLSADQITDKAKDFFDIIALPLDKYTEKANGFVMPAVIFDSEVDGVKKLITRAAEHAEFAIVSNLGQIKLLREYAPHVKMIADHRFNVANNESMCYFESAGFESTVLSTELTLPQIRDIKGAKAVIVYGRIPLMTLEKCVIKELYGDKRGCEVCARGKAEMKDRRGFVFPMVREFPHRNIVLNSLPTQMSDREQELAAAGVTDRHFLFTTESQHEVDRVIEDYKLHRAPENKVRRI
jgi:putative protease